MKRILYIFIMTLAVSCVKPGKNHVPESRIEVNAEIEQSASSKAVLEGTDFKTGNTIGIFVYHSETENVASPLEMSEFSPYGARYKNIRAVLYDDKAQKWRYNFENANTSFDDIYLMKPTVEMFAEGLAVVAYAPWVENVSSITEIPFTLGGESDEMADLMWARQNTHDKTVNPIDAGENYKIVPDGNAKPVNFTFQHALSLLRVGFRCGHEGSLMTVTSITLKKKEGGQTPLIGAGLFNAMAGRITDGASWTNIVYDYTDKAYTFQSTSEYMYVPVLICPQEYKADEDYILEFTLNGQKLDTVYKIKKDDVNGGFKAGEIYTFNFTVDNYIQFDGVSVSTEWVELDANKAELKF